MWSVKIKDLPPAERPRERLLMFGANKLSNTELLAILIRTGNKQGSALDIARRVLAEITVLELSKLSAQEIAAKFGVGLTAGCILSAAFELARRLSEERNYVPEQIQSATEAACVARRYIVDETKENFITVFLNGKNRIVKAETTSVGISNMSIVEPREIFSKALLLRASGIIIAHNHPSGDTEPSEEDVKLTRRIKEGCLLLNLTLLDHIILGNGFTSLRDKGLV
ncbi:MAG: DNA repair protein RadC [Thermoplasmata archaeon]|nr:DNA repair protein RadC [Thermoplasmata archaeon]